MDESGVPHLVQLLTPGVELLRQVDYQLARVDDFNFAVQAAFEARGPPASTPTQRDKLTPDQVELLEAVYDGLDAPLDERFRSMHPWLPRRGDLERGAGDGSGNMPFGRRGRWEQPVPVAAPLTPCAANVCASKLCFEDLDVVRKEVILSSSAPRLYQTVGGSLEGRSATGEPLHPTMLSKRSGDLDGDHAAAIRAKRRVHANGKAVPQQRVAAVESDSRRKATYSRRHYGPDVVSSRVAIRFDLGWYKGTIETFDASCDKHHILFDDGDQLWFTLSEEDANGRLQWHNCDTDHGPESLTQPAVRSHLCTVAVNGPSGITFPHPGNMRRPGGPLFQAFDEQFLAPLCPLQSRIRPPPANDKAPDVFVVTVRPSAGATPMATAIYTRMGSRAWPCPQAGAGSSDEPFVSHC